MSVKKIFLTIIGTISLMIVSFILIEVFNISIVSTQLSNLTKTAAYQTCTLFTQETYKLRGQGGAANMSDINDVNGTFYISGKFYNGNTVEQIWRNLYVVDNADFTSAMGSLRSDYTNLDLLMKGIENSGSLSGSPTLGWDLTPEKLQEQSDNNKANQMFADMYTPANIGIPYMDPETINKIFKWEIAQILSSCNSENIHVDQNNEQFVMFKGFRCYASQAEITNINYKTYKLYGGTLSTDADKLKKDTGLLVKGATANGDLGIDPKVIKNMAGKEIYDNATVTAVEIEYTIPVAYEGITPVRSWFGFMFNSGVNGLGNSVGGASVKQQFDDTLKSDLSSADQKANKIPTTGKLIYTLVK